MHGFLKGRPAGPPALAGDGGDRNRLRRSGARQQAVVQGHAPSGVGPLRARWREIGPTVWCAKKLGPPGSRMCGRSTVREPAPECGGRARALRRKRQRRASAVHTGWHRTGHGTSIGGGPRRRDRDGPCPCTPCQNAQEPLPRPLTHARANCFERCPLNSARAANVCTLPGIALGAAGRPQGGRGCNAGAPGVWTSYA